MHLYDVIELILIQNKKYQTFSLIDIFQILNLEKEKCQVVKARVVLIKIKKHKELRRQQEKIIFKIEILQLI